MKKTLFLMPLMIAVAALTAQSSAATKTYYWAGNTGDDLLKIVGSSFPYLSNENHTARLTSSALDAITTEGDTTYDLYFYENDEVSFSINQAAYFNCVTVESGSTLPQQITIDFGTNGSITTAQQFNIGNRDHTASLTLSADFSAGTIAEIMAHMAGTDASSVEVTYTRDILVAKGNNGFWNIKDRYDKNALTFSSKSLESTGLTYAGIVGSIDDIKIGQYGLVFTEIADGVNSGKTEKMILVAKTPEPATATLSLLALAGLCARRRRH